MINMAHIHPMLVHFPLTIIFLVIAAEWVALLRGDNLGEHRCLVNTALALLVLAALAAILAAVFGDIAMDIALDKGFTKDPIEEHASWGITTAIFFTVLALVQSVLWWRRRINRMLSWIFFVIGVLAAGSATIAAYHGGELVYKLGVNVEKVHPKDNAPDTLSGGSPAQL